MSRTPPLVYIDAQVFAYRLLPGYGTNLLARSTRFFKDIEAGRYHGVISSLTESEYRGIVKKVVSNTSGHAITQLEENTAMKDFSDFVKNMGIAVEDADALAIANTTIEGQLDIFKESDLILENAKPYLHSSEWKAIGATDAVLAKLASIRGADFFATFDRGFKGLNHSTLRSIIIQEIY